MGVLRSGGGDSNGTFFLFTDVVKGRMVIDREGKMKKRTMKKLGYGGEGGSCLRYKTIGGLAARLLDYRRR